MADKTIPFPGKRSFRKRSVLVVDADRHFLSRITEKISCQRSLCVAAIARNGFQAVQQLEALQPDILLLNLVLPEIDGIAVLEEMENISFQTPPYVLVLSTSNSGRLVERLVRMGADYVLVRPANDDIIVSRLCMISGVPYYPPQSLEEGITDFLLGLGLIPVRKHFHLLRAAVLAAINSLQTSGALPKQANIYQAAAEACGATAAQAERGIRSALNRAWNNTEAPTRGLIFQQDKKPSTREFITALAELLRPV